MPDTKRYASVRPSDPGARPRRTDSRPVAVIGIGAAAGGLKAIQSFFVSMPTDRGVAFVICHRPEQDAPDNLVDRLGGHVTMPVRPAEDGQVLEADTVYVMRPSARMILLKDRLVSFDQDEDGLSVPPLDLFLHALAACHGPEAIAVILSGAGSDGVRGAVSIRRAGGLVLVQDPDSAEVAAMPKHVIDAGLASMVTRPDAMAGLVGRYLDTGGIDHGDQPRQDAEDRAHGRILEALSERFGIDFRTYRSTMVSRRIHRRAVLAKTPALADYADLLADDPEEQDRLYDDLLIRVTAFFRDAEAFSALGDAIVPELVERMAPDRPARLWVPGCASGEEAYSLAMLIADHADARGLPRHLDITATDLHPGALETARLGVYRRDQLAGLTPKRIERYLIDLGDHWQICPEIRRLITFRRQNLIEDPPLGDMDLVSCRNLLIYLSVEARQKALDACRRAMKPGGVLFLGPSETPGPLSTAFAAVDNRWRIYRRQPALNGRDALRRLPKLQARRPAETIRPPCDPGADPGELPGRPGDGPGVFEGMIEQNQQMLESTIDTLLASNDTLRRRNRDLRAENQRFATANAALDDVATIVAHDLKAPLRTVGHLASRIETALQDNAQTDGATADLRQLQDRLVGLRRLIDDLLTYARQGALDSPSEQVDIGGLIKDVLTVIGLPSGFKIEVRPPPPVVRTQRIPLECIFRNLLGNALHHHGDLSGRIQMNIVLNDGALDVRITDDGPGFAPGREGLGLAIVRQLLDAHGGNLALAPPTEGQGTEARFTWPIEQPERA